MHEIVGTALGGLLVPTDTDHRVPRGVGPVAFAALPFDPHADATFIVPRESLCCARDGSAWHTVLEGGPVPQYTEPDTTAIAQPRTDDDVAGPTVRSLEDPTAWKERVRAARDELRAGVARKVVLARAVEVRTTAPIDQYVLLRRLQQTYGNCLLYAVDGFVGASPELLVARDGDVVRAQPMAGTRPRTGIPSDDAAAVASLLSSAKDREEHQITIDAVIDAMLDHCSYLDAEPEPSVVSMANVAHLASMVEGRLSRPAPSVLELVQALHPTPAVGGDPRQAALEMIARFEHRSRGPYAGPVGWVDAHGNGEFAVGIRGALLDGTRAEVWAGVGVVADSDPDAELAETEAKLAAMLGALSEM